MNNKMALLTSELNTLCMSCMHDKGHNARCSVCGYDERQYKGHPLYLKPRTILKNQYVIGMILGQGGFGITYIGQDLWLQKKVAIKEYLPAVLATRDVQTLTIIPLKKQENTFNKGLQWFIDEARNLAKFDHPNIVRVINFFEENKTGYMVMDYLDGSSPMELLEQAGGRLPVDKALAIIFPLLDALTKVHAQNIYHRDISIQNTCILKTGRPILIDFGAARHIVGGHSCSLDLVLKQGYSPLEQYSGKGKIGPWTDIYACGALLYLMITGILPPPATDRFCEDTLVAPAMLGVTIASSVNQAVMQALAIKIENRFQTVQAFEAALQGQAPASTDISNSLLLTQTLSQQVKHEQRKGYIKIVTIIVSALFLLGSGLFFYFKKESITLNPLLMQAQTQLANDKLTMPKGDNAYETYQKILFVSPNNAQAKIGLLKIAKFYLNEAQRAKAKQKWKNSLEMAQQGLQIRPTDKDLLILVQSVKASISAQAEIRTAQVKQLLKQAEQNLAISQLQAAYLSYQKVLAIESDNQSAHIGLRQVAKKYVQIAQTQKGTLSSRLSFINEGLTNFPDHLGLLALKKGLNNEQLTQQRELEEKQTQQRELEAKRVQQIKKLLKKAALQLSALRLTTPPFDNAYETYQKIFSMAPDNSQARAGLEKIADKYEQLARNARNLTPKKLAFIERGLKVLPTHAGLIALRQILKGKEGFGGGEKDSVRAKRGNEEMIDFHEEPRVVNQIVPPQYKKMQPAHTSTHSDKSIVSDLTSLNQKPPVADNTVQNLLKIAQQHLYATRLEAAYRTYRNVLEIVPGNRHAKKGLQQVAHRYEQLAKIQNQKGDLQKSLSYVKKGLAAYPTHQGLLTLQAFITRRIDEKSAKTEPLHLIFTPSF
jgi:serine/threonine protein kinase